MALATNYLTRNRSNTDGTSYQTGDVTPTAAARVLLWVITYDVEGTPETPTLTGTGWADSLSWTNEAASDNPTGVTRMTLFSATVGGSPSSGHVIMTTSGTMEACSWALVEFTDDATPDVNQAVADSGTTWVDTADASVSLSSPTGATCGCISALGNFANAAGTGFTLYAATLDDDASIFTAEYATGLAATNPVIFHHNYVAAKTWVAIAAEVGGSAPAASSIAPRAHFLRSQQGVS